MTNVSYNEEKDRRVYEVEFDGSNVVSEMYLYRLKADGFIDVKKILLLK